MSEEDLAEIRREGLIESKREYGCPCGKTYLSYPALFTHVKQKHNGKVYNFLMQAPGALIKPKTEKARGRPKLHIDVHDNLRRLLKMTCRMVRLTLKRN